MGPCWILRLLRPPSKATLICEIKIGVESSCAREVTISCEGSDTPTLPSVIPNANVAETVQGLASIVLSYRPLVISVNIDLLHESVFSARMIAVGRGFEVLIPSIAFEKS